MQNVGKKETLTSWILTGAKKGPFSECSNDVYQTEGNEEIKI